MIKRAIRTKEQAVITQRIIILLGMIVMTGLFMTSKKSTAQTHKTTYSAVNMK